MLARDYGCVGGKGSVIGAWATKEVVEKLGCIGSDRDGAVTVSDTLGNVQVLYGVHKQISGRPSSAYPSKVYRLNLFSCSRRRARFHCPSVRPLLGRGLAW